MRVCIEKLQTVYFRVMFELYAPPLTVAEKSTAEVLTMCWPLTVGVEVEVVVVFCSPFPMPRIYWM